MSKKHRSPVVVVLGHVDHGKTTLLDYIRKSHIASKEAGKITQGIGGYEAKIPIKGYHTDTLTFIDTPGHEAFTRLRARGARIADIAILIVDATASVKPQTKESIELIQQAELPYIVAMNKMDVNTANPDRVKSDLSKAGVLTEGYGGDVPVAPISALKGDGVEDLLEAILIMAADMDLTYDENGPLEAYIVETRQDKGGILTSCVIKNGSLSVGDTVFAGEKEAKVRTLINDVEEHVKTVYPSQPFGLLGFKDMPDVGSLLTSTVADPTQNDIFVKKDNSDPFGDFFDEGLEKKLKIVVKADNQGSLEALIPNLQHNENIDIIMSGVGEVSESDIFLAKVSKAIVIGFATKVSKSVEQVAKTEKVVIKTYDIIYKLLEELQEVSEILKEKEQREKSLKGEAKVQAIFKIDGSVIVGVKVSKGKIEVNDRVEWYKGDVLKDEAIVAQIKQRAHDVEIVKKGEESGLLLEPQLDIQQGDVIKSYSI